MLVVGLSGCLGSGKSTVGKLLAAQGAAVIDTDQVARDVLAPGTAGAQRVIEHFGPAVHGRSGAIDRQALAGIVFADPAQRVALEAITHPLVREEVGHRLAALGDRAAAVGPAGPVAVVEIPLLDAERRAQYGFDVVVLVETEPEIAIRRAVRRGMTEADARARMAAQPSEVQRLQAADRTIANDGPPDQLEAEVQALWEWLRDQSSNGPVPKGPVPKGQVPEGQGPRVPGSKT